MMARFASILACSLYLALLGCGQSTPWPAVQSVEIKAVQNNLAYFGFAGVDCQWDDPGDSETKSNYVDEVGEFTNLAQLCVYSPQETLGERLTLFRQAGLKALLSIEPILFETVADAESPSGEHIFLASEAEHRWRDFLELNQEWLTPDYVAAVYIADEPVWRGVSEADFTQAVAIVKNSLPNLPTAAIEAYPVLDDMIVPVALDWIGFDHYGFRNPSQDEIWLAELETVRAARTRDDQQIIIVAETQWHPSYRILLNLTASNMDRVAASYFEVASTDPDVVALVGYIWPGGLDSPSHRGARALPETVQQVFRQIGQRVLAEQRQPGD